jgi:hypothetical protein
MAEDDAATLTDRGLTQHVRLSDELPECSSSGRSDAFSLIRRMNLDFRAPTVSSVAGAMPASSSGGI